MSYPGYSSIFKRFLLSLQGSRTRLIAAPRFSNISEQSEDEDVSPSRTASNHNRFDGLLRESVHKASEQEPKKKNFEIVDSDDDDDEAVVAHPRRSLDTGMSQQRPSLSRSTRAISPPGTSEDKVRTVEGRPGLSRSSRGISPPAASSGEDRVRTIDGRPGLSRASGNLAVNRDLEDSESRREENLQRPGLSRSKRPMSGERPGLNRSSGRVKETESPRASASGRSSVTAGSEQDSDEDDVILTGKKTKSGGGEARAGGRPSLSRRSPASTRKNLHFFLLDVSWVFFTVTSAIPEMAYQHDVMVKL